MEQELDSKKLASIIARTLDDKLGKDISILNIAHVSSLADYFVIVSGTSSTHIKALAEELEEKLTALGKEPNHVEGRSTGWILLDYGTVIVHIFTPADRENFNLEKLWQDAKEVDVSKWIIE